MPTIGDLVVAANDISNNKILRFDTRQVPAHSNLEHNEAADRKAKEMADCNDPPEKLHIESEPTLIFRDNLPLGCYPGKYIKQRFLQRNFESTAERITKLWNIQSHTLIRRTANLVHRISRKNPLDSSKCDEHKFRILNLHKMLPTLDTLVSWKKAEVDTCQRCNISTETHDHLWNCNKTESLMPDLKVQMMQTLNEPSQNKKAPKATDIIINAIFDILEINHPAFLDSLTAKGIYTDSLIARSISHPNISLNQRHWLDTGLAAWLHVFYKLVYKPRCRLAWSLSHDYADSSSESSSSQHETLILTPTDRDIPDTPVNLKQRVRTPTPTHFHRKRLRVITPTRSTQLIQINLDTMARHRTKRESGAELTVQRVIRARQKKPPDKIEGE